MGRRVLGLGSLAVLGIMLIYIALTRSPAAHWQVFFIAVGVGAIWMADVMRRATASTIELTPVVLRDADGTVIARVKDIQSMDRGFFAFKPSNGFLLKTAASGSRHWRPGLWWRLGRRIGIGGMTPGSQTKYMSEILAAMMATRDNIS
ncbi:hypothetical protein [Sulfitobacter noctilucae]|uniref:hypothetical protein n=1 Tax=Sulfitobacter noctilucae TaxID=1342302 RepID=UPI00069AC78C|nr:hypothetical protein [Sulfitobacter noctilucae]